MIDLHVRREELCMDGRCILKVTELGTTVAERWASAFSSVEAIMFLTRHHHIAGGWTDTSYFKESFLAGFRVFARRMVNVKSDMESGQVCGLQRRCGYMLLEVFALDRKNYHGMPHADSVLHSVFVSTFATLSPTTSITHLLNYLEKGFLSSNWLKKWQELFNEIKLDTFFSLDWKFTRHAEEGTDPKSAG